MAMNPNILWYESFQKETSGLEEHTINTAEKSFKCKTCGKGFARSSDMNRHMRIHIGEKFNCTVCFKTFLGKRYLT
ncbi:hypothetical protein LOAG_10921 [Loa loa]|uniref:C2H2-type domain-containing protein n=1 Tax=Loa loa TaxID=7209 RepID=A0A1S0TQG8_LOALO|nr:hypothetical protein LOAG_10921 [Loa loa]EFO17577.2 hypothetical protein LOAG_10921 [Loa loa]